MTEKEKTNEQKWEQVLRWCGFEPFYCCGRKCRIEGYWKPNSVKPNEMRQFEHLNRIPATPFDELPEYYKNGWYTKADQIMPLVQSYIKEAGYVQLDKDQTLPIEIQGLLMSQDIRRLKVKQEKKE